MSKPSFDFVSVVRLSPEQSAAGVTLRRYLPRRRMPPARAGAFSLIELLVAMTVTLILVVALMQIFNAAASTWQHGEAQVDAYREARGALQLMARDLSATLQASYAQDPNTVSATNYSPPLPTLALQHSPNYNADGGPNNEEVYFLTNIPNNGVINKMSSLCPVHYFCQWMPDPPSVSSTPPPANGPRAYALMRQSLDSNNLFTQLKTATAAGHNPLTFDDLYANMDSPVQLAAYIWDLRFRIDTDLNDSPGYAPDGNASTGSGPVDHSSPPRFYRADAASKPYPPRLPPYVEIRFKALSDIAGRRLEGQNTGITKSTWADPNAAIYRTIIQPNAQQFVLRVPLINATPLPTPTSSP